MKKINLQDLISKIGREPNLGKFQQDLNERNRSLARDYILITYNQIFRNTLAFWTSLVLLIASIAIPNSFAAGGSAPNDFTKVGSSWVDVDEASKIYLEPYGNQWDDYALQYLPAGQNCSDSGIAVTGPALVPDGTYCADPEARASIGKIPLPFAMNFFGTTYSDTYITTNGNMSFSSTSGSYDISAFQYAAQGPTSVISPLSLDLYYDNTDSNIWFSPTTIDGKSAFIFSWEDMHSCCESFTDEEVGQRASFQLVIIENGVGSGNFEAWFNFDKFEIGDQGYGAPQTYIDLNSGITVGTNEFIAKQTTGITNDCLRYQTYKYNLAGSTDPDWLSALPGDLYVKLLDAETNKIAIYTSEGCTEGSEWIATSPADTGNYLRIKENADAFGFSSITSGWAGYRESDNTISATEFFANIDLNLLLDSADDPVIERSLNTSVVGRFVLFMSGGDTYGDPDGGPGTDDLGGGDGGGTNSTWVGEVSTTCSEINPGDKEVLKTASNIVPRKSDAKNLVGNYITQENLDTLGKSDVFFDAISSSVKTATAVLPDLGCSDHLVKVKVNQPIQFIVGGFKLQSNAQGYIQTPNGTWHNLSSTTLVEDTAAFLHTIQFQKMGIYIVVITQQPALSEGMPLPVLGINSARFKVEVGKKKSI